MKKLCIIIFVFGLLSCESELEIPLKVSKNFWYKYENAKDTEWTVDQSIYQVTFSVNRFPKTATFKANGEWIRTISPMPPKRSMLCVRDFVDENYPELTIVKVVFIETFSSERYFVSLDNIKISSEDSTAMTDEDSNDPSGNTSNNDTVVRLAFDSDCAFVGENPTGF